MVVVVRSPSKVIWTCAIQESRGKETNLTEEWMNSTDGGRSRPVKSKKERCKSSPR